MPEARCKLDMTQRHLSSGTSSTDSRSFQGLYRDRPFANIATLPMEVILIVMEYNVHDIPTLKSWTLACRFFSPPARALLFRRKRLVWDLRRTGTNSIVGFAHMIETKPDVGMLVTVLGLSAIESMNPRPHNTFNPGRLPWDRLPNLRALRTTNLHYPSMADLFTMLDQATSLEVLDLTLRDRTGYGLELPEPLPARRVIGDRSFPPLKQLSLDSSTVDPPEFMRQLRSRVKTLPLESLRLGHCPSDLSTDYLAWVELVAMSSATLRQVEMHTRDGGVPTEHDADAQYGWCLAISSGSESN